MSSEMVKSTRIEEMKKKLRRNDNNQVWDQCFRRIQGNENTTICQVGGG
tara:strand:- start:562 stop:708 length:147 start_codon:yes stop_codon:yes gene_type:complete